MKRVKIAELKDQLSSYQRSVERGAEVEVTDRDRPIARIVPVSRTSRSLIVRPPRRPFSTIRGKRHAPARSEVSSTELLLGSGSGVERLRGLLRPATGRPR